MNRQAMTAPFADEELHTFEGRGGKTMTYVEDETVMDRLDLGYGFGNWRIEVDPIPYVEGAVKVRLGIREHGEWIWYEDFGYPNRQGGESLKEAVSDGIRRCGRFVGIARDLYRRAPDERRTDIPAGDGTLPPITPPDVETEELVGDAKRSGMVRLGEGQNNKLEARQGPDGHMIGFRLETDKGAIPQVYVEGAAGEALFLATSMNPGALRDTRITVKGRLFNVKRPGKRSYFRLHVTEWENADYSFPAKGEDVGPEPPEDLQLIGEKGAA